MTIESLAESFREAKAKAGHPARIKYPKKLKDAAIEYFKANPKLTPCTMASMIGISTSYADKWFKSVKQAKAKDQIKIDPLLLTPKRNPNRGSGSSGPRLEDWQGTISSRIALGPRSGLKVRCIGGSIGYDEEIPKNHGYGCASKNGFSIHAATSIKAHERDRLEQLLRYLGRGPVAHDKISLDQHGNILYELKKSFDGATHVLLSPLEFIEKLAAIIPPPYRHQVNYYGCLSSHSKLRPLIVQRQEIDAWPTEKKPTTGVPLEELLDEGLEEEAEKPSRYIPWAELFKRTSGIDLTVCPHCGGHVRVTAAIIRKEAIREIFVHLNLPAGPPTTAKPSGTEYVYESIA